MTAQWLSSSSSAVETRPLERVTHFSRSWVRCLSLVAEWRAAASSRESYQFKKNLLSPFFILLFQLINSWTNNFLAVAKPLPSSPMEGRGLGPWWPNMRHRKRRSKLLRLLGGESRSAEVSGKGSGGARCANSKTMTRTPAKCARSPSKSSKKRPQFLIALSLERIKVERR